MKLYKLWLEIEEFDSVSGTYRNLSDSGESVPVPVAVFATFDQAKSYAEAFAMDNGKPGRWVDLIQEVN